MIQGLPNRLKDMRKQFSLSQKDVAVRLNVSVSIISGYETGERTPSLENALALADLYRCSMDTLLLGRKDRHANEMIRTEGLTGRQIQLITELIDTIRIQDGSNAP